MNLNTPHKYLLLTALYFAQGLPFGFFDKALPVIAREQGVSRSMIGVLSLLAFPWVMKFIWAPLVDRYHLPQFGRRRSWLIPLQICTIGLVLVIAMLNPATDFVWILVAIFFLNLFAATQDVATDGLAIKLLNNNQRGIGNGIQVAAYRAGMVMGGGVMLIYIDELGWSLTFQLMALMLTIALLPTLLTKEPTETPKQLPPPKPVRGDWPLLSFINHRGVLLWLAFIVLYKIGDGLSSGMVKPMIYDAGYEKKDIGLLLGIAGSVTGLIGALFGGYLCSVFGAQRLLIPFILLQGSAAALYGLVPLGLDGWNEILVLMGVEHVISGMHTAAIFTLMMAAVRPAHEGNDYTIQASVFVAGGGIGIFFSGFTADAFGYTAVHSIGAILIAATVIPLLWIRARGGFNALRNNTGEQPS